jgi:hypothetical protein
MVNATIPPIIEPWIGAVDYLMDAVKVLVGGLFGLYVAEFIYRIAVFRKNARQLKTIYLDLLDVKKLLAGLEKRLR